MNPEPSKNIKDQLIDNLVREAEKSNLSPLLYREIYSLIFGWRGLVGIILFVTFFIQHPFVKYLPPILRDSSIPIGPLIIFAIYILWIWFTATRKLKQNRSNEEVLDELNKPFDSQAVASATVDGKIVVFDTRRLISIIFFGSFGTLMLIFGLLSLDLALKENNNQLYPFAIIPIILGLFLPLFLLVFTDYRILKYAKKIGFSIETAHRRFEISRMIYMSIIFISLAIAGYLRANDLNFLTKGVFTSNGEVVYRAGLKEENFNNLSYEIDGRIASFENGLEVKEKIGDISIWGEFRIYGDFSSKDLNGDGKHDAVFTLIKEGVNTDGKSVYGPHYVAVALSSSDKYVGTNAIMISDEISSEIEYLPQIKFVDNLIKVGSRNSHISTFRTFTIEDGRLVEIK